MPRLAVTVAFTVATLPAIALAQAPGECTQCAVPAAAPAPIAAAQAAPDDMVRRIGVGAHVLSLSLDDHSGADPTQYGGGGLLISYRLSRRWELALAMDGAQSEHGPDLDMGLLMARFHMNPHANWDWYLLAGIGGIHDQVADTRRGQFHLGVGVERRWEKLSISAELHGVGVGPIEPNDTMPIERTDTTAMGDGELGGGEFTIAAMFYF